MGKKYLGKEWPVGTAKTQEEWAEIRKQWEKDHPIAHWFEEKIEKGIWWPIWRFLDKYFNFVQHGREIKWFIQRGTRGWADRDAWGYFSYNARVNREVLEWLKVHKLGHPVSMYEYTEHRNPTYEEEKEAIKKWNNILDDMIFGFDCIAKEGTGELYLWYPNSEDMEKILKEKHPGLYDDVHFQTKEEHDRMEKGMRLFIEHYLSLWD